MTDMWAEASADHEALAKEAALARADADLEAFMPFLLAARSTEEYIHRSAIAQDSIAVIAASHGLDPEELLATARRRYDLYRQALAEGENVLEEISNLSDHNSNGSGPEKPDEHNTGPDFSHGYSEVPAGAPGGPDPQVTHPRPPQMGQVTEATGSLRRQAVPAPGSMMMPPSPSAGAPAAPAPAPAPTPAPTPAPMPSSSMAGTPANLPAGVGGSGGAAPTAPDLTPAPAPDVASTNGLSQLGSADPVRRRVMAVTAAIAETNPQLPAAECERVARQVVGRYFRRADLTDSVMSNGPIDSGGGDGGGSSGGDGGSGGGGMVQHGLEWQGLKGMMPGGGGGAAGVGGLIADAGELAAL